MNKIIFSKVIMYLPLFMGAFFFHWQAFASTTPLIGEEPSQIFYVNKQNPNAFQTIQAAINGSNEAKSAIIFIAPGIYHEKLYISRNNLSLIGSSATNTSIEFAELRNNWRKNHASDWGAAVINIAGSDINIVNLTVINNYGRQHQTSEHQFAIRGFENASRIILHQCHIIADGADTVSLWNKKDGMYYHSHCTFEGYTDMVCPRGSALIQHSTFINHKQSATLWHDGELDATQKLVVSNSRFQGVKGFWLGRHHYDAQFYLINNQFSTNMANKPIFRKTYQNKKRNQANRFGARYFFFDNHFENLNEQQYPWLADNFTPLEHQLKSQTMEQFVFGENWSPNMVLKQLQQTIEQSSFNATTITQTK